jgi:catechol 2,3-dioxygenase
MGHMAFRATSPEALERRVAIIEASGLGKGWTEGDLGHGPAYAFTTTDGHNMEIYYETEWYAPPPELKPSLKNQAQRFPAHGANVRRIDHVNLLTSDVAELRQFMENVLGMRTTEMIVLDNGKEAGAWVTTTNKTYDLAFTADHYGARGRFHHVTYALDSREEVLRAADIFLENGVYIETGPHKHAVQQTFFLYVYEPGGNRVEVDSAGARLMLAPDWQPVVWTETERRKGQAWGLKTIESFHTYGTPPIEQYAGPRRSE